MHLRKIARSHKNRSGGFENKTSRRLIWWIKFKFLTKNKQTVLDVRSLIFPNLIFFKNPKNGFRGFLGSQNNRFPNIYFYFSTISDPKRKGSKFGIPRSNNNKKPFLSMISPEGDSPVRNQPKWPKLGQNIFIFYFWGLRCLKTMPDQSQPKKLY